MKSTAIANSNIAFVKYWGKKDYELNIPSNPSISMTLDENLSTKTTVEFDEKYTEDLFILNDEICFGVKLNRVSKFLDIVRKKAGIRQYAKVMSVNTFPTASGIASSASGFCALALAGSKAAGLELEKKELSALARQGSGSAARSVHGGFVFWKDKFATEIKNKEHWPELRDVIIILSQKEKKTSSRKGMKITAEKSKLYKKRQKKIKKTLENVKKYLHKKNFSKLAKEIMDDSDNMHDCINEAGINYLTKESLKLKKKIIKLNKKETIAAYTFDAGPNMHIITLEKHLPIIEKEFKDYKKILSGTGKGARLTEEHLF